MSRSTTYVIALGSNRRHGRHGPPRRVLAAALAAMEAAGIGICAASRAIETAPIGPSRRRFANQVAIVESALAPPALLARLKTIERDFGRRKARRWAARVLDLDIVLWSGGIWAGGGLTIPHPAFRERGFVLTPLRAIAPRWRDPATTLTITHLAARLERTTPVDRKPHHP